MRKHKRFAAILTAGLLAVTPCVSAGMMFAEAADYTISVNSSDENASATGYTYKAYQIFKGDVSGSAEPFTLSNIDWADDFNSSGFLTDLASDPDLKTGNTADFSSTMTVNEVIAKLKSYENNDVKLAAFARLAKKNIGSAYNATSGNGTNGVFPITVNQGGYYLVEETGVSNAVNGKNEVYSRFMLEVAGDASATVKRVLPSLTKEITSSNQNTAGNANTAAIGDTVEYKLTSAVPNMTGYNKYYFVVNDTLQNSLTFNQSSVVVSIDDGNAETNDTLTLGTDYEIQTGDAAAPYTFQIVFKDFYTKCKERVNQPINITYSAVLNQNADISDAGNKNTANLTYSNNPNYNYQGDGDEPGTDEPKGITPDQIVKTYTTAVKVKKVDENTNALTGAEFTLTGNGIKTVLVIRDEFVLSETADDASAPYWKLKNGTYTDVAPNDETSSSYDDVHKKYTKTQQIVPKDTTASVDAKCLVGTDGIAVFQGLGKGQYTLTETVTPTGYNTISPIQFEIKTTGNEKTEPDMTSANWSIDNSQFNRDNNMFEVSIQNVPGQTLPSTGGIGTKLFYLFGGLLAIGSGVVLVTKKRMANIEK